MAANEKAKSAGRMPRSPRMSKASAQLWGRRSFFALMTCSAGRCSRPPADRDNEAERHDRWGQPGSERCIPAAEFAADEDAPLCDQFPGGFVPSCSHGHHALMAKIDAAMKDFFLISITGFGVRFEYDQTLSDDFLLQDQVG